MDFQARMNALSTGDKVVGGGLLVSLIALFLPWYSVSVSFGTIGSGSASVNGFRAWVGSICSSCWPARLTGE